MCFKSETFEAKTLDARSLKESSDRNSLILIQQTYMYVCMYVCMYIYIPFLMISINFAGKDLFFIYEDDHIRRYKAAHSIIL